MTTSPSPAADAPGCRSCGCGLPQHDLAGDGAASRRLARLVENHVLAEEPYKSLHVPLDAYLRNGSNYETVRLIALSDGVLGRDSNYGVSSTRRSRRSAEHPNYARGVAGLFWDSSCSGRSGRGSRRGRRRRPSRRRRRTRATASCFDPQANVLVDGVPSQVSSVRVRVHRLLHAPGCVLVLDDPAPQRRYPSEDHRANFAPGTGRLHPAPGSASLKGILRPGSRRGSNARPSRSHQLITLLRRRPPGPAGDHRPVVGGNRRAPRSRSLASGSPAVLAPAATRCSSLTALGTLGADKSCSIVACVDQRAHHLLLVGT